MRFFKKNIIFLTVLLLFTAALYSQTRIEVGPVYLGEVESAAFHITQDGKIRVSGYNSEYDNNSSYTFYGWIIKSDTREVIWHSIEDSDGFDDEGIYKFDEMINLKSGDYEIYYTGVKGSFYDNNYDFGDLLSDIFGSSKKKSFRRNKSRLKIEVEADESILKIRDIDEIIEKYTRNSIVSINRAGDEENYKKYFNLKRETEVRIYCLGEGADREYFDYAWITDTDNREKVWKIDRRNSDFAGGARKNIVVDETITLPAGNYEVTYTTDDSHSFDDWNALPPTDPNFYGITIWPANEKALANVGKFEKSEIAKPVVELNRVREDKLVEIGLRVKKEIDMRVLCIGEEGYSKSMVDYGWIVDAETKEIIWEMKKEDTEYAGGAKKNRMIDDVFTFDKGNYIVYYVTDDSHSYRDWNDSKPFDPEYWGITIWTDKKNDNKYVETFDPSEFKSDKVLVEMTRIRSNQYLSKSFKLDKTTNIRIIALGEGERREMFDYGWIENRDNGRTVWKMKYRRTEHAGGARKNRIYNDVIKLPEGNYKVYFETDDSHAYRDWNTTPPRNPESYGITVLKEK